MPDERPNRDEAIQALEAQLGGSLNYTPLNPEAEFAKEDFLRGYSGYGDLASYKEKVMKDGNDYKARQKFSRLLFGNKTTLDNLPAHKAREMIDGTSSQFVEATARYAQRHQSKLLDLVEGADEGQALASLVFSVPLYVSGESEDKEYNTVVSLHQEVKQMDAIRKGKDGKPSLKDMRKFLSGTLATKGLGRYAEGLAKFLYGFDDVVMAAFDRELGIRQQLLNLRVINQDGTPNKKLLRTMFERNMEIAQKELDDEEDEGDKGDAWEINMRPHYLALADMAYNVEKAEADEDNEDEKERIERMQKRRKKGMSF